MADIHIHRSHSLGLPKARQIAWRWAEEVEEKFGMECTVTEGDDCDTVDFTRSGVKGSLLVAADSFELKAQLGFLLGAFSRTIESEIKNNLDTLLAAGDNTAKAAGRRAAVAKPAAKTAKAGKTTRSAARK